MKELQKVYSISEGESLENNTYLSISKVVADCLDRELYVAFKVLDAVLCSSPGAPLKKAMIEKGIGTEVYSIFEEGVRQPYFSVVAKNAELSQKQLFLDTYDETLQKLVKEGINKKSLYAALNAFEFKHREADFGSYQKGLMYGIQILDSWLHDDRKPFIHLEANDTFAKLLGCFFQSILLNAAIKNIVTILIDNKSADIHFNTLEQLNILYDLWLEV